MAFPPASVDRGSLIERVAAIKHDLGKYVAWRSANLDESVWTGVVSSELVDALRADLLSTRSLPDHRESAWEVWAAHRVGLPEPLEPELERVAASVAVLAEVGAIIDEGDPEQISLVRADIRRAQQEIRDQLRRLHRRLLEEG